MKPCLKYCLIATCIVFVSISFCKGQRPELHFKHISTEQGLSNSTIESIFQDSRGFMWFGTRDGLNRYDGYQMTVYKYDSKDTTSISDNYINCIYEDRSHILWVGTNNGLNAFDTKKNRFTRYKHYPDRKGTLTSNHITCITQGRDGTLWFGTFGGGLNYFQPQTLSFASYRSNGTPKSLSDNQVNSIFEDNNANIWIGTEKGLNLFLRQKQEFMFYPAPDNSDIRNIAADKEGNLWLGTEEKGLLRFDRQQQVFYRYQHQQTDNQSLGSDQVRTILIAKKGNVWVGGINGGLNLLRASTNSFFNYQNEPENPFSLSQRTISALFEDRQGNLWIGTHRGGLNLYTPSTLKFNLFRQDGNQKSISYNDIRAFCEDGKGNIWIGTDGGGLNLFDRKSKSFRYFQHNPYYAAGIGSNEILHVTEDSEGNLWVSSWGGGLNVLKTGSNSFEHFVNNPADPKTISSNYIQKTFEDHNKNLWVATYYGGLNLFDRKTKTFTRVLNSPGSDRLYGNNIVSMEEDRVGNLWIGTDDGGLNKYNPLKKTVHHYFDREDKAPDLRVLFIDKKGRLWLGQAGLYLFNETLNSFSLATNQAGLNTDFIKGITEDDKGNLWISSSNGLTQFNPETKTFKKYNTADGLQGLEFEANAYMKTKDGQMFFGGVNGFNSFYPDQIRVNTFIPPVRLTEFQIFNEKVIPADKGPLKEDISVAKEIKLNYNQSTVSFAFAALDYTAPENNQYAYKLEGLEKNWNAAGKDHKANYTNLDPGTYTFRVKASNNDGIWNEQGTAIKIVITPPFWQAWWFTGIMVLLFSSAVIAYYQFRRRQEIAKLELARREEMQQMQLQFFTNISHEFRTPLSLIIGPLEKLQKENIQPSTAPYYKVMHRNASRLLVLINELMDFRKAETGALKLKVMPGNIPVFLQEIEDEFSELAQEKKIQFTVDSPAIMDEVWFDRQVLEKILVNLLSNSFKYTADGGSVQAEVLSSLEHFTPSFANELLIKNDYKPRRCIYLKVTDTGIGISKESIEHLFERYYRITEAHMGSGIGLAFVKSLTLLHKGSISVYSERLQGTEIIVALPVDKNDYTTEEKWLNTQQEDTRLETTQQKYEPFEPEESIPETTGVKTTAHQQHILVVDDNIELKTFIKESLQPYYNIAEAKDGMDGLQKAKELLPDLVISDVMMPVMDGVEFCKRLKEDTTTSHIPFMMLTAKDALESRIEGIGSGADFYFAKPVSIELLLLTIANIFDQKKKLKDRYVNDHHAEAKEQVHSIKDKDFLDEVLSIIDAQLTNPDLDVEFVCTGIGMSRTKMYQKIKALTGQSINDFVRTIRLKKAVEIMTHEDVSLGEVMFRIGIQTQSYFTKAFKKEFGKTPSQFLQELKR